MNEVNTKQNKWKGLLGEQFWKFFYRFLIKSKTVRFLYIIR